MKLYRRIEITKRGYKLLEKYVPGLVMAKTISAALEALSPFVTVWFSARIIDELMNDRRKDMIAFYVVLVISVHLMFSMIKNVMDKVVNDKESGMWNYFNKIFSDKQLSMDYVDLEDPDVQKMRQKAEENLFMFGNGLGQLIWDTSSLVKVVVGIFASVAFTASLFMSKSGNAVMDSWIWIPAILMVMALFGVVYHSLTQKENSVFEKWTEGTVWFNRAFMFYGHELYDSTKRSKDVRIYGQEKIADREMKKMEEHNQSDNSFLYRMSSCQGILYFSQGLCNAACYLFVALKAGMGAFGVGSIVQYVGALTELVGYVGLLTWVYSENKVYTKHLEKLFEYLDLPNKKHQGTLHVGEEFFDENARNCYNIEFKNVSFKYPGSTAYALKNINIKLKIGKKQAFVGANGAGKTTFVKLLCRLYDPTEGEILLNGTDIRQYDYEEYMKLFSFVFQDFKLFAFTLGQNIATDIRYDKEKIEECLKKVMFYDRYLQMEDGPDTYLYRDISENGVEISGGEAQKIALARALYRGAPMIVLDEPTAALDPVAEAQVFEDFSNMVDNKTAVYISHRLSSCRFCDEILVFDKGGIVQRGSHDELVNDKNGKYFELWNAQAQYYA